MKQQKIVTNKFCTNECVFLALKGFGQYFNKSKAQLMGIMFLNVYDALL